MLTRGPAGAQFWTIWGLFSLNSFNIVAVASLNKVYSRRRNRHSAASPLYLC